MKRLLAYTDGSSDPLTKAAGIGVVLVLDGTATPITQKSIPLSATSNGAEVNAIWEALKLAAEYEPNEIVVYTDSLNAIGWITGKFSCNVRELRKTVGDVKGEVERLKSLGIRIGMTKCQGHAGIQHNELAHELAGEARKLAADAGEPIWL